jgi:hypothetical protein
MGIEEMPLNIEGKKFKHLEYDLALRCHNEWCARAL